MLNWTLLDSKKSILAFTDCTLSETWAHWTLTFWKNLYRYVLTCFNKWYTTWKWKLTKQVPSLKSMLSICDVTIVPFLMLHFMSGREKRRIGDVRCDGWVLAKLWAESFSLCHTCHLTKEPRICRDLLSRIIANMLWINDFISFPTTDTYYSVTITKCLRITYFLAPILYPQRWLILETNDFDIDPHAKEHTKEVFTSHAEKTYLPPSR